MTTKVVVETTKLAIEASAGGIVRPSVEQPLVGVEVTACAPGISIEQEVVQPTATGERVTAEIAAQTVVVEVGAGGGGEGRQEVFYDEAEAPAHPAINFKPVAGIPGLLDLQGTTGA